MESRAALLEGADAAKFPGVAPEQVLGLPFTGGEAEDTAGVMGDAKAGPFLWSQSTDKGR